MVDNMKAYKRLKKMAETVDDLISNDVIVADIATDHGYLAELLDRNKKIKIVYASDISQKCLDKIVKLKKDFNLEKVVPLLGDGLMPYSKLDLAVIAGVGGLEIIKIITKQNLQENGINKCNLFVLQPAQNVFEFRKWLYNQEIFIIKDFLVEDAKKFYPIIAVDLSRKQKNEWNLYNLFVGRDNDADSDVVQRYFKFVKENFEYLEKIDKMVIEKDEVVREKYEIYNMVNTLLK